MKFRIQQQLSLAAAMLAAALGLCLAAAAPAYAQSEQRIVVLVNDNPISAYDVDQREKFLALTTHEKPSEKLRKQAIDMLIDEQLQLQQGRDLKIFADEGDVNKVVENMAEKNHVTADGLAKALAQLGVNIDTLKQRIRAQLVWQDVIRQKFAGAVSIGQTDIDEVVSDSEKKGNAARATTVQVQKVRFALPSHASDAEVAKRLADADALRMRFRTCDSTKILASDFKASVTPLTAKAASFPQPARTLLLNADVGDMTAPSISSGGVELYAVCGKDVEDGGPVQRDTAERELMNQQMKVKAERLLRDLRQDAYIDYRK